MASSSYYKSGQPRSYKCLLVGDGGTGKTSFIKCHLKGNFSKDYEPTKGAVVHSLYFHTDSGKVNFQVWDTAGLEKHAGLGSGYYFFADCAIILFDLNICESCNNVTHWRREIEKVCGSALPIVVCGNKFDVAQKTLHPSLLSKHSRQNIEYFDISVKKGYNINLPFLWLCKKMLKCNKLRFVTQPKSEDEALPSVHNWLDNTQLEKYKKDMGILKEIPLPDNESSTFIKQNTGQKEKARTS